MEPIPETREAVEEFGPFLDDDLLEVMVDAADQVRRVVPSLVGLSLGLVREGLSFTVQATSAEIARLDAVQYLDGGPCAEAAHGDPRSTGQANSQETEPEPIDTDGAIVFRDDDPLAEHGWESFARATAAEGIASTLTLPVLDDGAVVGSVNLYAAEADAFAGHHQAVATVCRAWAPGAVTNADLDFDTRRASIRTPEVLRDQMVIAQAVGVLIARRGIDAEKRRPSSVTPPPAPASPRSRSPGPSSTRWDPARAEPLSRRLGRRGKRAEELRRGDFR